MLSEILKNYMNIFDTKNKIEINQKQLEFYYDLNQKLQSKFSFLVVIYSFIFFYLIELFKYAIEIKFNFIGILYIILFISFLFLLICSFYKTYNFLKPINISYLNEPKYFYNNILEQYRIKLKTEDEEVLDQYVNYTYLLEIEKSLEDNISAYQEKSHKFYLAFKMILSTLLIYIIISSIVIFEKRNQKNEIELHNYKEIIDYINRKEMAEEKPKFDPKMVIVTKPVTRKESGSLNAKVGDTTKAKVNVKITQNSNKK